MTRSYKELLVIRDKHVAHTELRTKVHRLLASHPETSGGEILVIETALDGDDPAAEA